MAPLASAGHVAVRDRGRLEVLRGGAGDPVLLVQTALTADELRPLGERLAGGGTRGGRFDVVLQHRRGYGSSSPARRPASVEGDARDCADLLTGLGLRRAHLVGVSYSAAVALELAVRQPRRVRSLTLIEPPPVLLPDHREFAAVNDLLLAEAQRDGARRALDAFAAMLMGARWRDDLEGLLPGAVAQMERDADTFFTADLPALLGWRADAAHIARLEIPVLHVGGTASGPWFAAVRDQVLAWLPHAEDVRVPGADHSLALTHADEVAVAVGGFLRRHPLRDGRAGGLPGAGRRPW